MMYFLFFSVSSRVSCETNPKIKYEIDGGGWAYIAKIRVICIEEWKKVLHTQPNAKSYINGEDGH